MPACSGERSSSVPKVQAISARLTSQFSRLSDWIAAKAPAMHMLTAMPTSRSVVTEMRPPAEAIQATKATAASAPTKQKIGIRRLSGPAPSSSTRRGA